MTALGVATNNGPTLHALGLLETRAGNSEAALDYLGKAAALEQTGTRHRFVYAIALHDLGEPQQAVEQLQGLVKAYPENQDVLLALANYSAELGRQEQALMHAQTLLRLAPGNQGYQQLYLQLQGEPNAP